MTSCTCIFIRGGVTVSMRHWMGAWSIWACGSLLEGTSAVLQKCPDALRRLSSTSSRIGINSELFARPNAMRASATWRKRPQRSALKCSAAGGKASDLNLINTPTRVSQHQNKPACFMSPSPPNSSQTQPEQPPKAPQHTHTRTQSRCVQTEWGVERSEPDKAAHLAFRQKQLSAGSLHFTPHAGV